MQLRGPHTIEVDGVDYPVNLAGSTCAYKRDVRKIVYVITTGEAGPCMTKVGIAKCAVSRFSDIQALSPVKLKLWWQYDIPAVVADWVEQTSHDILRGVHCHHEWFRCTPGLACKAINLALMHVDAVEHFYLDSKVRSAKVWREVNELFPKEPMRTNPHRAPTIASLIRESKLYGRDNERRAHEMTP